jgi:cellulose synthase/poly-beta-1,6-N-acetylglucosamine synthase-like glycosyltransferase
MTILLWLSLFIAFYAFFGYGILLFIIVKIKRMIKGEVIIPEFNFDTLPTCTIVVAAYNEEGLMGEKIKNTLALVYPADKLEFVFITDGSTDGSADIVNSYPQIRAMHSAERKGKIAAIHRAMETVNTEVVVFTDANTFLNGDALINICRHYSDAKVGAVAGEKRVYSAGANATAGEGFYWKYESKLKAWDSELYSVVGAAGELFSIRTELYQPVAPDTILDDFMISLIVTQNGYRVIYEPAAFAIETASQNVTEELKRKIRIAAGGIQSIIRLKALLNPIPYPVLTFQYVSHRVLRWTIVPFLMILALLINLYIVFTGSIELTYQLLLLAQVGFYLLAISGWIMEERHIKIKIFFIPYYFCMMNYAVIMGIGRYFSGRQSAVWEKAKREQ